jgi:hypothetical protein
VLARRGDAKIELENQGVFDELVLDDWLHVEQMENAVWWLRVGDARLIVTLQRGAPPILDVERGFYAAANGTTKTRE